MIHMNTVCLMLKFCNDKKKKKKTQSALQIAAKLKLHFAELWLG